MPKKQFTIECDGQHLIELTWKSFWKNFTVYLDGAPLGTLSLKELRAGESYSLPGGSTLDVRLKQALFTAELQVLQDGRPLPGSATDPVQRIKQSYTVIFVIGGFNLLLGIAGIFAETEFISLLGAGWGTAVFGIFLLLLGWLVKEKQSLPALITAIFLYVADGLIGIAAVITSGGLPGIGSIIIRVLFILGMAQGLKAIREIEANDTQSEIP